MRALVVYESMFGNTRTIAEAVGEGLSAGGATVQVVEVGVAPPVDHAVDLLVVGGPTHAFSMSRPDTRRSASERGAGDVVSRGGGIREWLDGPSSARISVATFDTRVSRPRVPGSAARAADKRLQRLGHHPVASPQTFWVAGMEGPLLDGEPERARRWGTDLTAVSATKVGSTGLA